MELTLKELDKKDYKKIIQYAIKGMNFNVYIDNKTILNLYGKYFFYSELLNATQVLAVYYEKDLAGVLLAEIYGEPKYCKSISKSLYVKFIEFIQSHLSNDDFSIYDETNKKMLKEYKKENVPSGEIRFLSANPNFKGKGIGTMLMKELEKREKGKEVYLFTDDKCTYQFYEHRGFEKKGEEDIEFGLDKKVSLKCFLYRKIL